MKVRWGAQYILRFDDICPTMSWGKWKVIENILNRHGIAPVLAVIPDNRDQSLMVDEPHPEFWHNVRSWQERGWTIGLHGYQHTYVTDEAGLVGLNKRSEFAGLSESEQELKLKKALALFRQAGVVPEIWVAPGHSFEAVTLRILKGLGLHVVSDGFYLKPNTDGQGITHIPQQLWRFRPMPFGLWTVCFHHNHWTQRDFHRFETDVLRYKHQITSVPEVLQTYRIGNRRLTGAIFSRVCLLALQGRSLLKGTCRAQRM